MPDLLSILPPEDFAEAAAALAASPELAEEARVLMESSWGTFTPRPDRPEIFDEQESFVNNRDPVSFLIGGNGSGTSEAAGAKIAKFLLHDQPPPRKNTPFWIISNTYEQVCGVLWGEKLLGHGHIPECEIDWNGIHYMSRNEGWPFSVPLKPWPGRPGKNWKLEFKSYEQGRRAMQARSIGGFCFSEQFPWTLFIETLRGCREYMFPGGQFAEFTPIEPDLCIAIEKAMDDPVLQQAGWRFYRCNTEANRENLAEGWFEQFFATVPDEMLQTRLTGALATFEGCIYQSFNPAVHVVGDEAIAYPFVPAVEHYRGVDWGASAEHPQTCVWAYRDGIGNWFAYDEYWCADQGRVLMDHAVEIVARSLCWGWPTPQFFAKPRGWQEDFARQVKHRAHEIRPDGTRWLHNQQHRDAFADPSRPDSLSGFDRYGISTTPAANNVYKGIDCIRSLLKINPVTERPRLLIHKRCKHLIEELRKYRWVRGRRDQTGRLLNPKVAAPIPLKRDDDCCDALRYLCFSAERSRGLTPGTGSYRESLQGSVPLARAHRLAGLIGNGRGSENGGWFHKTR